jgi:hypothetical protein
MQEAARRIDYERIYALAANCSDVMSFLGIVVLSISHTKRYFWRTRRAIQLTASLGLLSVSPRQDGCLDATHRDMCSRGLRVCAGHTRGTRRVRGRDL